VSAGAFIAEDADLHALTFTDELGLIICRHTAVIISFLTIARVPHGEDDASLGG